MGMLGPDSDLIKGDAMEEGECQCMMMEEAVCAINTNTVADCVLGTAERLLGAVAVFAISHTCLPNQSWMAVVGTPWQDFDV